MANAAHIEEATANNIPFIDVDGLKAFNKDKTKIKSSTLLSSNLKRPLASELPSVMSTKLKMKSDKI